MALLALASVGLWAGFFGPIRCCWPSRPRRSTRRTRSRCWRWSPGSARSVSVICNPLAGAFSDRTTLRAGRRLPWLVGGALGGRLSLAVLSVAPNVAVMLLGWCGVQAALNAMLAAVTAMIPDQVPGQPARPDRRDRRSRADHRRRRRDRHRGGDRQHRGRLPGDRGVPAGARGPVLAVVARPRAAARGAAAVRRAPVPRVVLDLAAAPSGLRLGVADPVPGQPRQRAGAPLSPLLPAGRDRLQLRRGGEPGLRAHRGLRAHAGADHGRLRRLERPARAGGRCSSSGRGWCPARAAALLGVGQSGRPRWPRRW